MLTRTIIQVGHDLGIEVVAEGIERPEHLELLREMGCGLGQGYLIAKPMDASGIEALVSGGWPGAQAPAWAGVQTDAGGDGGDKTGRGGGVDGEGRAAATVRAGPGPVVTVRAGPGPVVTVRAGPGPAVPAAAVRPAITPAPGPVPRVPPGRRPAPRWGRARHRNPRRRPPRPPSDLRLRYVKGFTSIL